MTERRLFSWPLFFWGGSAAIALMSVVGCTSEPDAVGCTPGETVSCMCGSVSGTSICGNPVCSCDESPDTGVTVDSGVDSGVDAPPLDTPGDATHLDEKEPPATVYGACAAKGSFGWPCSADASGPDPVDCTDPTFPDCFVGGQSSWCTASCATFGVCPAGDQYGDEDGGDSGCVPVACNARGYCK